MGYEISASQMHFNADNLGGVLVGGGYSEFCLLYRQARSVGVFCGEGGSGLEIRILLFFLCVWGGGE